MREDGGLQGKAFLSIDDATNDVLAWSRKHTGDGRQSGVEAALETGSVLDRASPRHDSACHGC